MALAGYCRQCTQYVYLTEQWECVNGHAWNEICGWYDPESGVAVTPPWMQPAPVASAPAPQVATEPASAPAPDPAPVATSIPASDRLTLLADLLVAFAPYPSLNARYGTDADIVIDNEVASANWGAGGKEFGYSAVMKAVESDLTLYFWDGIEELGADLVPGGAETVSKPTDGVSRSSVQKMLLMGGDGAPVEWEWDYAKTRDLVESVTARNGWQTKVVAVEESARW